MSCYTEDNCPHVCCSDCKYYSGTAYMEGHKSYCKRIDNKVVQFYYSSFMSNHCGERHIPCADFKPRHPEDVIYKNFTTFEEFWPVYVKAWIPYGNTNIKVGFYLNDDTDTVYRVPLMKFVDGTMISHNVLHAVEKMYYVRDRIDHGVQLYRLVYEPIHGVKICPPDVEHIQEDFESVRENFSFFVEPQEIWSYFESNKEQIKKEPKLLAQNESTKTALYLSAEQGIPLMRVLDAEQSVLFEEGAVDTDDCAATVMKCTLLFLSSLPVNERESV